MADFKNTIETVIKFVSGGNGDLDKLAKSAKGVDDAAGSASKGLNEKLGGAIQGIAGKVPGLNKLIGPDMATAAQIGTGALIAGAPIAAAAIAKFVGDSVSKYAQLAETVASVAESSGLKAQDASRWVEVAEDLGIGADKFEGSIGKLNKALGSNNPLLEQYGIKTVFAKDGTVDMNATLLDAIGKINAVQDPTKKAALASAAFGKSWADAAELIGMSTGDITDRLKGVSNAKVLNKDDIASAREYRDALDALKDRFDDIQLTVGKAVVPALVDMADKLDQIASLGDKIGKLDPFQWLDGGSIGLAADLAKRGAQQIFLGPIGMAKNAFDLGRGVINKFRGSANDDLSAVEQQTDQAAAAVEGYTKAWQTNSGALDGSADAMARQTAANEAVAQAARDATDAFNGQQDALAGTRDAILASIDADFGLAAATRDSTAAATAYAAAAASSKTTSDDLAAALEKASKAALDQATAAVEAEGANTSQEVKTQILISSLQQQAAVLAPGSPLRTNLEGYIAKLQAIPANVSTTITTNYANAYKPGAPKSPLNYDGTPDLDYNPATSPGNGYPRGATGGIVTQPTVALIGEAGPEAVIPLNQTPGSSPLGGGVTNINITVNAGMGANGRYIARDLIPALETELRRNGMSLQMLKKP